MSKPEGDDTVKDEKTLEAILDIGKAMIESGAETHRVEDSMYRLCGAYGFEKCNVWVMPSNIQATVRTPDGEFITQMRHIRSSSMDFAALERLNALSRSACVELPDHGALAARLSELLAIPQRSPVYIYLAGLLSGLGFGLFFNCGPLDLITAALSSLLVCLGVRLLSRIESNPLIFNFILSFLCELFILLCIHLGLGTHPDSITVTVIMLLISAMGTANGLRDLVHLDTLSGMVNITVSFTGAIGIALGIALPLYLFPGVGESSIARVNPNSLVSLFGATVGCTGFAYWFRVSGKHVLSCTLGTAITWLAYLLVWRLGYGVFAASLFAAAVCCAYAQIAARLHRAPATIFTAVCVFCLIPGSSLYYMMRGLVIRNAQLALEKGAELMMICFAIVLGSMVVEVLVKLVDSARRGRAARTKS